MSLLPSGIKNNAQVKSNKDDVGELIISQHNATKDNKSVTVKPGQ